MVVFEGLAAEAIEQCVNSLFHARDIISERRGPIDAQLFLIKHLLTLREQVAPFEVSFTETQIVLDFSVMKSELRKVLSGGISALFSPTALAPQITTSTVDSLQKVGKELTFSIETFVVHCTNVLMSDLMSFLVQVSSFERVGSSTPESSAPCAALQSQPWASLESFERVAKETVGVVREKVPELAEALLAYLSPAQARTLFLPIRDNVLDSWEQFLAVRSRAYPPDTKRKSNGKAEESPEDGEDGEDNEGSGVFLSLQEMQELFNHPKLK